MAATPGSVDTVPFTSAPQGVGRRLAKRSYAVPLVVAVTGHRDLLPSEVPQIRTRVRDFLVNLRDAYPDRLVLVMSPLAEGADRLVAEEAITLGMPLTVPLPMPKEQYVRDFETPQSRAHFDELCAAAVDVFELPLTPGNTPASIRDPGKNRSRQYAQAGVFLCAHCHVLLALWDGKVSHQLGGTSQVVRFHHHDVMPGYTPLATASRLTLTDDESDLVYHIVCSRDRPDGAPAEGFKPLDAFWFTTDENEPRSTEMPLRHRQVFERANEFSLDAQAHADGIDRERYPLLTEQQAASLPPGLLDINQVFCAADWLAIYFQKRFLRTLRVSHVCVFLTGLAYVSYTDFNSDRAFLFVVLGLMIVATGFNFLARRGAWHRKYLDYRTLAEGLRVQFYWAAAGVTSGTVSKFAHDNFLQMQDPDLGWIRNVMRVAGTECDVRPNSDPEALKFVVREWIGDDRSGQLGYFSRKSAERARKHGATQRLGQFGLWASAMTLAILMFIGAGIPDSVRVPITYAMGCVLLAVGVRQSYAKSTAESELIKQYDFMHRIFYNARRRLDVAESDFERRRILKLLGDAALEEHAQWILMHRERAVEQQEIVKLS
jgi:hypothetical protein